MSFVIEDLFDMPILIKQVIIAELTTSDLIID